MTQLTQLLQSANEGDVLAARDLLSLVYDELRRLAAAKMAREQPGQTLQATALVHEAWLRLNGQEQQAWANSRHFFCAAAEAMRRILIERARRKARQRHGGSLDRVDINELDIATADKDETLFFVNDALDRLATKDPDCAELIKLRYFAGLPNQEAARLLGMSERTAKREWAYARAWLSKEIKRLQSDGPA